MAVVVIFLKDYVYWMLTIPVGALVYVGMSFLTRALTLDHLRSARTLMSRPKYAENPVADN